MSSKVMSIKHTTVARVNKFIRKNSNQDVTNETRVYKEMQMIAFFNKHTFTVISIVCGHIQISTIHRFFVVSTQRFPWYCCFFLIQVNSSKMLSKLTADLVLIAIR